MKTMLFLSVTAMLLAGTSGCEEKMVDGGQKRLIIQKPKMAFDYCGGTDSTWIEENRPNIECLFLYTPSDTLQYNNQDTLNKDSVRIEWLGIYRKGNTTIIHADTNRSPFPRKTIIALRWGIHVGEITVCKKNKK